MITTPKNFFNSFSQEVQNATLVLQKELHVVREENGILKERIALLQQELFGQKSEKKVLEPPGTQCNFFDLCQEEESEAKAPEIIQVPTHPRKKKRGRKPFPENLARIEVIHDLSEEEKQCACGSRLTRMGEETSEQLQYIPAQLQVIQNIRPKYACQTCQGVEDSTGNTIKIAPVPAQMIPKSIATPSLLAHIITAKFVDALPFYRQEQQFLRLGIELSRKNMAYWTIKSGSLLEELLHCLQYEIMGSPLLHIDETTLQVLKEPKRSPTSKSYVWAILGGRGVYFHYSASRSASVAQKLLKGYQGVVVSDGYAGYNFLNQETGIEHAGCWAHSRRKFIKVIQAKGKQAKRGNAEIAIEFIRRLYGIEKEIRQSSLSEEEKSRIHQEQSKPILKEFHQWLLRLQPTTPPEGLLGKAISYTLNYFDSLCVYANHSSVPMDNNPVENAIRPFVLGRKNWLFCSTVEGAIANSRLYSLIETAKMNGWNPLEYLTLLFEKFPLIQNKEQLKGLLPQYLNRPTMQSP